MSDELETMQKEAAVVYLKFLFPVFVYGVISGVPAEI